MIWCSFSHKFLPEGLQLEKVFDFLARPDLNDIFVPNTKYKIDENIVAQFQMYTTVPAKTCRPESHKNVVDIQYMLQGKEIIEIAAVEDLIPVTEYDSEKDILFYERPELSGRITMREGDYAIFTPDEAHTPQCAWGDLQEVKKIVIKIKFR